MPHGKVGKNEGTGNRLFDLSRNGNQGILNGTTWAPGRDGLALELNGSTDYIDAGGAVVLTPPFSFLAMIYPTTFATSGRCVISLSDDTSTGDQHALIISDAGGGSPGNDVSAMSRDGGAFQSAVSTKGLTVNTWHTVAGVWRSNDLREAFVDGGNIGTNTGSATPSTMNVTEIGRLSDSTPNWEFQGLMGLGRIINRALSVSEILRFHINPYAMFEDGINPTLLFVAAAPPTGLPAGSLSLLGAGN